MITVLLRITGAALSVYLLLIVIRILLSWLQGFDGGRGAELLHRVTDPYLNWFRRFEFLRIGSFDFSVVLAIVVLSIVTSIVLYLAAAATITFGLVVALIIARLSSAVGFFVVIFLILSLVRAVGSVAGVNSASRFWITVDQLLEPIVHKTTQVFARGRFMSYRNALVLFAAMMAVILFAGGWLVDQLVRLAIRIPF
jgi:YggT family protein